MFEARARCKGRFGLMLPRDATNEFGRSFLLINEINRSNGGLQPSRRYETDHNYELTLEEAKTLLDVERFPS